MTFEARNQYDAYVPPNLSNFMLKSLDNGAGVAVAAVVTTARVTAPRF